MKNKNYPYHESAEFQKIYELLDLAVKRYGSQEAYVYKKGKTVYKKTFLDLSDDANSLAAYFISQGYKRKRIAILGDNSYEWIVTWFATVISGNIVVPLDKMLATDQLHFIIKDTGASVVFYSKQFTEHADFFKKEDGNIRCISMDSTFAECVKSGSNILKEKKSKRVPDITEKDQTAVIIYTSGTTGVAKGVILTQYNFCTETIAISRTLKSSGSNMLVLPLNHAYALVGCVLVVMNLGRKTYICSGLKRFTSEIKEFAPTEMYLVPLFVETMYCKIMDAAKQQGKLRQLKFLMKVSLRLYNMGIDIRRKLFASVLKEFGGNLELLLCGAAPIDPLYLKSFRAMGITVLEGYGITECSPVISVNRNRYYKDGSVGLPLPGVEVKTDAQDGRSEGEIYIKGSIVMPGYFENDKATAEAFDGNWFKTGDIGCIDNDGFIYITGRKKNIIILSNGKNLYPEELEQQIQRIPAVSEVLVYEENNSVTAEIFPNIDYLEEKGVTNIQRYIEDAIENLNSQLPAGKSIASVRVRESCFEKTATQKIIRKKYAS